MQQKVPSHSAEDLFGAPLGTLPRSKKRPAGAFLPAGTWDGRHELFSSPTVHERLLSRGVMQKNKPHASVGLILVRHFRPKTNQVLLRGRTGGRPQLRFTTMRHFTSFSSACKTSRRVFSWLWYSSRPMTRAFSFGLFFRYCCLSTACLWSINRYRTRCSFQSQCTATSLP